MIVLNVAFLLIILLVCVYHAFYVQEVNKAQQQLGIRLPLLLEKMLVANFYIAIVSFFLIIITTLFL